MNFYCKKCMINFDEKCPVCGFNVQRVSDSCFQSSSLSLNANYIKQDEIYSSENRDIRQAVRNLNNYEFIYHSTSFWVKKYLDEYLKDARVVLDIGFAGNPRLHFYFHKYGIKGIGVDISLTNCVVQAKISEIMKNKNVYIRANALDIPIPDESVDFIIATDILEHISAEDKNAFFGEMKRVLKKGGKVLIRSPFEKEIPFSINYIKEKMDYKKFWQKRSRAGHFPENAISRRQLKGFIDHYNFDILKFCHTNFFLDHIYDYVLPEYARYILNILRKQKNRSESVAFEDITAKDIHIHLSTKRRLLNYFFKLFRAVFLSIDRCFCLMGFGNHFIVVCKKT